MLALSHPLAPASQVRAQLSSSDEKQGKNATKTHLFRERWQGAHRERRWAFGAGLALSCPWEVKMQLMPVLESTCRTGQSSKNSKMSG